MSPTTVLVPCRDYAASGVLNRFLSTVRILDWVSARGVSPYTIRNAGRIASLLYTTVSS